MDDLDRYTRITLRIPKDLHVKLQAAADSSSKSMNAEIIERVENSFFAPDPSAALNAINRLEADLSAATTQLDETERLALLMSIALASTYGLTRAALKASPEDMGQVEGILSSGISAVRSFASSYTPKGMEALVNSIRPLKGHLDSETYENLVKAVTVSSETNSLVKKGEERALSVIQGILDKHNIQEAPHSRRFSIFAAMKDMPHPDEVFEQAVQYGESDDPLLVEERKQRGLVPPSKTAKK